MGITVYTKQGCIACRMTEQQFAKAGVNIEVVSIEDHPEVIDRAKAEGLLSAPLIETPDGRVTAGFDPDRIKTIVELAAPATPRTQAAPGRAARSSDGPAGPSKNLPNSRGRTR